MSASALDLGSVYATLEFRKGSFNSDIRAASRQVNGLDQDFGNASQGGSAFARTMGTTVATGLLAVSTGAAAAGVAAIKMGGDFEQSLSVLKYNSGATAAEFKLLSERARELGQDASLPGITAADAANAMNDLAKAGLSVNDVLAASKGVLSLAKAGNVDVGLAANTTARALNAFSLEGKEANRIADLLAAAANASTADVQDLAYGLQMAGSGSKQMGVSLDDTITALALFSNAGIAGSDAGTSLKTMFQALANPVEKTKGLMRELGLDFFDAKGQFIGLSATAELLQTKLMGLTAEQRNQALAQIFGADSSRVAGILATEGAAGFDKMAVAVGKSGAATDAAAAYNAGFKGSLDFLKSTLETVATDLGTRFLPSLTALAKILAEEVNPTIDYFVANGPGIARTVGIMAAGFAVIRVAGFVRDMQRSNDVLKFFIGAKNANGIRAIGSAFGFTTKAATGTATAVSAAGKASSALPSLLGRLAVAGPAVGGLGAGLTGAAAGGAGLLATLGPLALGVGAVAATAGVGYLAYKKLNKTIQDAIPTNKEAEETYWGQANSIDIMKSSVHNLNKANELYASSAKAVQTQQQTVIGIEKQVTTAKDSVAAAQTKVNDALRQYGSNSPQYKSAVDNLKVSQEDLNKKLYDQLTANFQLDDVERKLKTAREELAKANRDLTATQTGLSQALGAEVGVIATFGPTAAQQITSVGNLNTTILDTAGNFAALYNSFQIQAPGIVDFFTKNNKKITELQGGLNDLQNKANNFTMTLGGGSLQGGNYGSGPGRNAAGTSYWGGGPTWVGEQGPELLVPPRGSQIIPNYKFNPGMSMDQSGQTSSSGGRRGDIFNLNISNNVDEQSFMRKLTRRKAMA